MPLVERSHIYERVQLVEYYQKIMVTYLDHSGIGGGCPLDGVSGGVATILTLHIEEIDNINSVYKP